jgi:hypothetical protein
MTEIKTECCICKRWYGDDGEPYTPTYMARLIAINKKELSHGYCRPCFSAINRRINLDLELESVGADMGAWRT